MANLHLMGSRRLAAFAWVGLVFLLAGCASHQEKIGGFREAWGSGDYVAAEAAIDRLIASECGASLEVVQQTHALAGGIDASEGNTYLMFLEKAMVRLALRDAATAVRVFCRARDQLDAHWQNDWDNYMASIAVDDEALDYTGADYEHIMVRALLAICDLVTGGGDVYAYALQVGEKQEEIIGSSFGFEKDEVKYHPREHYKRVAIGAYLQGVIQEDNLAPDEAAFAYRRAAEWAGSNHVVQEAVSRTQEGAMAEPGHGVLHVFYLAGRGPHLVKSTSAPTETAKLIAQAGLIATGHPGAALGMAPVPVPQVAVTDSNLAGIQVSCGGASATTERLLDVNQVAQEQLAANMDGVLARAAARRAVKAVAAAAAEEAVKSSNSQNSGLLGLLTGMVVSAALTGGERAETRNWTSLPAEIQVARLEVPTGRQTVQLGTGLTADIQVEPMRNAYVILLRPSMSRPGILLVDARSRALTPELPEIPEPATQP